MYFLWSIWSSIQWTLLIVQFQFVRHNTQTTFIAIVVVRQSRCSLLLILYLLSIFDVTSWNLLGRNMLSRSIRAETRSRAKEDIKRVINAIDKVRKWWVIICLMLKIEAIKKASKKTGTPPFSLQLDVDIWGCISRYYFGFIYRGMCRFSGDGS